MKPSAYKVYETNHKKENQMNNKPENWEVVEVSDNLLDNFSSFISYEVKSSREHIVAKSLTQNDANLIASAPEMLEALKKTSGYLKTLSQVKLPSKHENIKRIEKLIARAEGR